MRPDTRAELARRVRAHLRARTTDMAEDTFRNPVAAYTSQERFEREHATLFRRYPLLTALSCELPAPGSYLTQHELAVPILLVRGRDGVARAFANVCRHRGARVAQGCGAGAR